jgi:hypothetical protein
MCNKCSACDGCELPYGLAQFRRQGVQVLQSQVSMHAKLGERMPGRHREQEVLNNGLMGFRE